MKEDSITYHRNDIVYFNDEPFIHMGNGIFGHYEDGDKDFIMTSLKKFSQENGNWEEPTKENIKSWENLQKRKGA